MTEILLPASWKTALSAEFTKPYFTTLTKTVRHAYLNETIYPAPRNVFAAFTLTPLEQVKVVILGQDPYHGSGQAMGLAFSVPTDQVIPPSLRNIYQEIKADIGRPSSTIGDLTEWSKQGVLLLNSTLTVKANQAGSHQNLGWETFTNAVIKTVSDQRENVAFILWGAFAGAKRALIDEQKHLILTAPHPSPLSAHRGFFGSKHFSQANQYLTNHHQTAINW